jgi:hypothetical protein
MPPPGKTIVHKTYVHASCVDLLSPEVRSQVEAAERRAGVLRGERYNVIRFEPETVRVALLSLCDNSRVLATRKADDPRVILGIGQVIRADGADNLVPEVGLASRN